MIKFTNKKTTLARALNILSVSQLDHINVVGCTLRITGKNTVQLNKNSPVPLTVFLSVNRHSVGSLMWSVSND